MDGENDVSSTRWISAVESIKARFPPARRFESNDVGLKAYYVFIRDIIVQTMPIRYMEFGVGDGELMKHFNVLFSSQKSEFFGFDVFGGPSDSRDHLPRTADEMRCEVPKILDARVRFVNGSVHETLPKFIVSEWTNKITVIHFRQSIYSDVLFVLATLFPKLPRLYVIFSDFSSDQVVALRDYLAAFPISLELLGIIKDDSSAFFRLQREVKMLS